MRYKKVYIALLFLILLVVACNDETLPMQHNKVLVLFQNNTGSNICVLNSLELKYWGSLNTNLGLQGNFGHNVKKKSETYFQQFTIEAHQTDTLYNYYTFVPLEDEMNYKFYLLNYDTIINQQFICDTFYLGIYIDEISIHFNELKKNNFMITYP